MIVLMSPALPLERESPSKKGGLRIYCERYANGTDGPMLKISQARSRVFFVLFLGYLLPLFLLGSATHAGWGRWSLGLLFLMSATLGLYIALRAWETTLSQKKPFSPPEPTSSIPLNPSADIPHFEERAQSLEKMCDELSAQLQTDLKNINQLQDEKSILKPTLRRPRPSLAAHQSVSEEQLSSKNTLLEEYQQTITDQRQVIEKKQKLITALETKVNDLKYELKTLLDLTDRIDIDLDSEAPKPVKMAPNSQQFRRQSD